MRSAKRKRKEEKEKKNRQSDNLKMNVDVLLMRIKGKKEPNMILIHQFEGFLSESP